MLEGDSDSILIRENGTVVAKKEGTTQFSDLIGGFWSKSSMSATADKPELIQESMKDLQAQLKSETQKEKAIKKGARRI